MKSVLFVFVVAGMATTTAAADTTEISFFNITNNGNTDLSSQLRCFVSSVAGNDHQADFTFRNLVGVQSSVKEVYFDDGTLLAGHILIQQGTNFTWGGASPGDLPGGDSINPKFDVTQGFLADAGNGGPNTGINQFTDFLTVRFDLKDNQTYADVINALLKDPNLEGSLRLGLHVISIGSTGGSDSYVSTMVPLPPAAYAGIGTLSLLAGARYIRRRRLAAV